MKLKKIKCLIIIFVLNAFFVVFSCNRVKTSNKNYILSNKQIDSKSNNYFTMIDTIINGNFINISKMNNKEFFYINVNNKTLDSFGINFVDSLNLKPQVILIDNHKYSNFLFNENYLLVALPLFHINEYQCYVYKFNKQKDKITCFDIFDFSGSINFNSKNSKLEYYSNKEIEILTEGDLPIQKIIDEKINLIISKLCES